MKAIRIAGANGSAAARISSAPAPAFNRMLMILNRSPQLARFINHPLDLLAEFDALDLVAEAID